MKIAQYGTAIVVLHILTNGLHGLAHMKIPVALSLLQSSFVGMVIFLVPVTAAILLWTPFYRIGCWLLLSAMTGSLVFAIYNHLVVISPDHVSQVSWEGWGLLFQVSAILILVVNGVGCWLSARALMRDQQLEKML
ncbi:MAG TPA: hypothetical protein VL134_08425 [Leptolyngbya sp.]|jgi:hypothetical protein|nr:hypothetical protein [Leptolyngbya sp.]